ncbi:uncharacterized protein BJ171DRAFT_491480 [Polychytrium aggregatum]|uniref:uncharacterized protein n=1 Tax=Polychytrium aggregatum TaxID=110093 RepID=UPI0022FEB895|nr:uncharacterized protein BJ171DRAFT_491480 [Polychytrium aggregatum]KAI9207787.1 hypothetical protein BJ171DRAFT_491480 [Polychytrium aggregatum]
MASSSWSSDSAYIDKSIEAAVNLASKEFIKGFIAGQIILCILIFFLLKVFLLRSGGETKIEIAKRRRNRRRFQSKLAASANPNIYEAQIVSKTQYDINSQPSETLKWLNVILAQIISKYRSDKEFNDRIISLIDEAINGPSDQTDSSRRPSFLGHVAITEFSLGEQYPIFKDAKIRYVEYTTNLRAEIGFEYNDQITIGIDTQVLINWPKAYTASLPVSLSLSIVKFSGTLALEFVTLPDNSQTYLSISILEDFMLEFEVRSLLGHRTKVKDLPKLTSIITSKLQSVFIETIVYPCFHKVYLPTIPKPAAPPKEKDPAPAEDSIPKETDGLWNRRREADPESSSDEASAAQLG